MLHLCAMYGNTAITMLFLSAGCLQLPNNGGFTPLHVAAKHGHYEVVQVLIRHGADVNVGSIVSHFDIF